MKRFVSPAGGLVGAIQNRLANAGGLRGAIRRIAAHLPFPMLASDVRDVVYASWVVPEAAVADYLPHGVEPVSIGDRVILTILTYRHGHFGPAITGRWRRLFPSPLQSNWRLYVRAIDGQAVAQPTVLFLANIFDQALYAVGTRLMSDALVADLAGAFSHQCDARGSATRIAGTGSAPQFALTTRSGAPVLLPDFAAFFADWPAAVAALTLQDAAITAHRAGLAMATIDLPVPLASVRPLAADAYRPGALLTALGATTPPFVFVVPVVPFRVLSERLVSRPAAPAPAPPDRPSRTAW